MSKPTFEHSRKALVIYDATIAVLNRESERLLADRTLTGDAFNAASKANEAAREEATRKLQAALWLDTRDRNSQADCHLVHPHTIRAWVEGRPTP